MKTLEVSDRPRDLRPLLELASEENLLLRARSSGSKTLSEAELRWRLGLRPTTRARNRRRQASPTR